MKSIYFSIVTCALLLGSCSQKELDPTVMTLLTDNDVKSWQIVKVEVDGINEFPCRNDDIFVFQLFDEELELPYWQLQDNYVACFEEYITFDGFWRLNNRGDLLTLTVGRPGEGNLNFVYHIEYISDSELRLRTDVEDFYGFSFSHEYLTLRRL